MIRILEELELPTADQEFTSSETSINSSRLPAVFKKIHFNPGDMNLDYGGGKFDNVAEYLEEFEVVNLVYDPFNRPYKHNSTVLKMVDENGGADSVTCSNVLNVIKEEQAREVVIKNCYDLLKSGRRAYFTVYEGNRSGEGKPSNKGFQLNKKTEEYLDEISQVFSSISLKNKVIIAGK